MIVQELKKLCDSINASEERLYNEKAKLGSLESTINKRLQELDGLKIKNRREAVIIENLKQELIEDGLLDKDGKDELKSRGKAAAIQSDKDRIKSLIDQNYERITEIQRSRGDAIQERTHVQQQRDKILQRLKQLDDSRHSKMEELRQRDEDTYNAVRWIQNNKSKFKNTVFDPVALEINVSDKRYLS